MNYTSAGWCERMEHVPGRMADDCLAAKREWRKGKMRDGWPMDRTSCLIAHVSGRNQLGEWCYTIDFLSEPPVDFLIAEKVYQQHQGTLDAACLLLLGNLLLDEAAAAFGLTPLTFLKAIEPIGYRCRGGLIAQYSPDELRVPLGFELPIFNPAA